MIIHVQPEDELNTIIHRMQDAPVEHVTLVVAGDGGVVREALTWRMVAHYGQRWGKEISVDTSDPVVADLVRAAGLEVVSRELTAAAQDEEEARSGRTRRIVERLSVLLLIAAACLALIYVSVPKVTVVVTPAVEPFAHVLTFPLASLAAAEVVETEFVLMRSTKATGQQVLGISKAVGEVVLINQSQESVFVPRGTIVTTASNTPFQITADVEVPGVATQYFMGIPVGIQAGQATAPIEALLPGSGGNVAEGRIIEIVDFDLDVRNPEPTRGGADTILTVAAEGDLVRVREMVQRDAGQMVLTELRSKISGRYTLLADSVQIGLEWEEHTPLGAETEEVFAAAKVTGKGYALDTERFAGEVERVLGELLPTGHVLIPQTLQYGAGEVVENTLLQLVVEGMSRAEVQREEVADKVLGAAVAELDIIAGEVPAVARLEVRDYTGEYLPRLKRWLNVVVAEPEFERTGK